MLITATKTKVFFTTTPTADEQCTNSESVVNSNRCLNCFLKIFVSRKKIVFFTIKTTNQR